MEKKIKKILFFKKEFCCLEDNGQWFMYLFNKRKTNNLTFILDTSLNNYLKLKFERISFLYRYYFIDRKVPFRIAYILEKNNLSFSKKDKIILSNYFSSIGVDNHWI